MKRPVLGRAGAGALILVALLAAAQAIDAGAVVAQRADAASQPLPPGSPISVPKLDLRAPAPAPGAPQPVIPLGRPAVRVPILMYHYVRVNPVPGDNLGFNLSVTPDDFRKQLDWLAANGYHPVDFDDLRAYFAGKQPLPAKPVVLTFDDGYKDLYTTAYPILREHNFKAVAYIVNGFLGAPNNVDYDQVREMDANGIEIGAHTVSHVDLTKTNDGELQHQVRDVKTALEALLGHPVLDFCYPAGQFNGRVVAAVQAAGYDTATTTAPGTVHSLADRLTWSRVRVSGGEQLDRFASDLADVEPAVTPPAPGDGRPHLPNLPKLLLVYPLTAPPSFGRPPLRRGGSVPLHLLS